MFDNQFPNGFLIFSIIILLFAQQRQLKIKNNTPETESVFGFEVFFLKLICFDVHNYLEVNLDCVLYTIHTNPTRTLDKP